MSGKDLGEGPEAPIGIYIINNQRTAWSQGGPCSIKLETYVAFAMKAVMNEEINLPKSSKQRRKASPA
jgi:hypothetical protein